MVLFNLLELSDKYCLPERVFVLSGSRWSTALTAPWSPACICPGPAVRTLASTPASCRAWRPSRPPPSTSASPGGRRPRPFSQTRHLPALPCPHRCWWWWWWLSCGLCPVAACDLMKRNAFIGQTKLHLDMSDVINILPKLLSSLNSTLLTYRARMSPIITTINTI